MKRLSLAVTALAAGVLLGSVPVRADFCVEITDMFVSPPSAFFRFKGGYPTKPEKITVLKGRVTPLSGGLPAGFGPAFGEMLGLHEGDAGNQLGVTFTHGDVVGHLALTLDDNAFTTGGGKVYRPTGTTAVGGQIVDCATEPQPGP